jgi:hypothetical protein
VYVGDRDQVLAEGNTQVLYEPYHVGETTDPENIKDVQHCPPLKDIKRPLYLLWGFITGFVNFAKCLSQIQKENGAYWWASKNRSCLSVSRRVAVCSSAPLSIPQVKRYHRGQKREQHEYQ